MLAKLVALVRHIFFSVPDDGGGIPQAYQRLTIHLSRTQAWLCLLYLSKPSILITDLSGRSLWSPLHPNINTFRKIDCSPLGGTPGVSNFRKEAEYKHLSSFFR